MDIIVNPTAGGKKGKKIKKALAQIESRLASRKIEYKLHFTEYKGHGTLLTEQAIKNGATDIIVMGGDGTLHEVINGFTDFDRVNLGIIPCGTGNDFASALKLPKDPIKALDLILDGKAQYTDYMQLPTVRGINIVCMGIDVDVLIRYSKLKRKNKLGYTWCLIKTLLNFKYTDFSANIDGTDKELTSFIACIANGPVYGGGIPICPVANAFDKQLEFLAVTKIKRAAIPLAFIRLLMGKIMKFKQTVHTPCQKISVSTQKPYTVNVDGELYENIPFDVEIVSDKLKVYR